uniref:Conotoxin QcIIIA n=1 Tax=Conus quercinus TaxID=101313 RepID=M3A_CONQU|nr:RecName: Full=Conotoxin QcIIIA [Conus quercinus]
CCSQDCLVCIPCCPN